MKYLSDQRGLIGRYLAEENNWQEHLENARDFIVKCLQEAGHDSVTVLGSGWLLDVPIEYIAENFKTVYLVDLVHPSQVVHRISKFGNVSPVVADVTGGAVEGAYRFVRQYRRKKGGSILEIDFQAVLPGEIRHGYTISVNLLSQIDTFLVDYLKMHVRIPEEEEKEFRRRIQSRHLSLLRPGESCLITDVEERKINRKGLQVFSKRSVHCNLPPGAWNTQWIWRFDSRGEYYPGHRAEMQVRAIRF